MFPISVSELTIISQVEVPITLTKVCSSIFAPTAPECASNVPTAMTVLVVNPKRLAHSVLKLPATSSEVYVSVYSFGRNCAKYGSNFSKKFSGGSPFQSACHIALCPAAQRLLLNDFRSLFSINI